MKEHTYLKLTDIHLFHRLVKTELMVSNLYWFMDKYNKEISAVDIIYIAGDIFDRLMDLGTPESTQILTWMRDFALYCKRNNIILRVLNGTRSHDFNQGSKFTVFSEGMDLKYIDTLHIEHIESLDLNVLYVPDEWRSKGSDTFIEVKKLLAEKGLSKVHTTILHGAFPFSLPFLSEAHHLEEDYLSITEHYIDVGHIHQYNTYERIISGPSFDRLSHGDDADKGCVLSFISDTKKDAQRLLVNDRATLFKTVTVTKETSIESLRSKIERVIKNNTEGLDLHIRIKTLKYAYLSDIYTSIKNMYPNIHFIKTLINEEKKNSVPISFSEYSATSITKDNLVPEFTKYLSNVAEKEDILCTLGTIITEN